MAYASAAITGGPHQHPAVDADTGEIASHVLTESHPDDGAQVPVLLGQAVDVIASVTAVSRSGRRDRSAQSGRDRHIQLMTERGRIAWQKATGYGRRNKA